MTNEVGVKNTIPAIGKLMARVPRIKVRCIQKCYENTANIVVLIDGDEQKRCESSSPMGLHSGERTAPEIRQLKNFFSSGPICSAFYANLHRQSAFPVQYPILSWLSCRPVRRFEQGPGFSPALCCGFLSHRG